MRSTFKILFYINRQKTKTDGNTAILSRITIDGKNTTIRTGEECNPSEWSTKQGLTTNKNPNYIFLDEATNSLDANNERMIVEHLDEFYKGKTVVIVAHRLSTVKNADQIVVLDKGKVVEIGNHEELTAKRGAYYNLVKNQLELGN